MTGEDTLDILLVEDNPGDARLIEEMLRDAERLLERVEGEVPMTGGLEIHHEVTVADGLDRSSDLDIDVILLDLGLPGSTGLEPLTRVTEAIEFVPVVVLTGLADETVGIRAIQHGAQDYLVKDEVTSDLLVRSIHYALERNEQERQRVRRNEQLESLNRLNGIVQEITHDVITASRREELERAVCERLVGSDAYRFAWIGEVDRVNDRVSPRVSAGGEDGYLEEITITVQDGDTAQGPAGKAVRTGEMQVVHNAQTDPAYEPWREEAIERGYRSGASIPISHDEFLYGVLNVYASSPDAFRGPEADVFSRLGDLVGHAITAIERKEALMADTALELEFQAEGVANSLVALTAAGESKIVVDHLVRTEDALIAYGEAEGLSAEEISDALDGTGAVDDLRILASSSDSCDFELVTPVGESLAGTVATHGGRIDRATISDGRFRFVVEFPTGRDKRQLVALVEEECPNASNLAQRTVQRSIDDASEFQSVFRDRLTEKQRTALEAAYFAGLFDWPRKSTGQEIADRLGVSPPTFNQHLRSAERKFFGAVFDGGETDDYSE